MAREKQGYRESIARIDTLFPGRLSLTVAECAQAVGCSAKTIRNEIAARRLQARDVGAGKKNNSYRVNVETLARWSLGG